MNLFKRVFSGREQGGPALEQTEMEALGLAKTASINRLEAVPEHISDDEVAFDVPKIEAAPEEVTVAYNNNLFDVLSQTVERLHGTSGADKFNNRFDLLLDKARALSRAYYENVGDFPAAFERFAGTVADIEHEVKQVRARFELEAHRDSSNEETRRKRIIDTLGGLLVEGKITADDMRIVNDALEQRATSNQIILPQDIQRMESTLTAGKKLVTNIRPEVEEFVRQKEAGINPADRLQLLYKQRDELQNRMNNLKAPVVGETPRSTRQVSSTHQQKLDTYLKELGMLVQAFEQISGKIVRLELQIGQQASAEAIPTPISGESVTKNVAQPLRTRASTAAQ